CGYSYPGYTNLCNDISTSYGGAANSVLTATGYTSSSVLLQARSVGTAGNGYCWTTNPANYANISNSGSCLSGGRNAGPPGTTNSTVPTTWNTATSGTTTDNQVTWTNAGASNGQTTAVQATGTSGIVIDNVYNPPWAASTNYRAGYFIIGVTGGDGYVFECTTAGTSGSTQPTWCATTGCTVTETTGVVWTNEGANPTANLYLGTLAGAKSAVKYTQANLQ